jgi:NAD+ synthase (glutamine-hydrolysing)
MSVQTHHGLVRVAAAVPHLAVADVAYNATRILGLIERAQQAGVEILVFPELSLTGYTCADLFHQTALQQGALNALLEVAGESGKRFRGVVVIGLPLVVDDQMFNCAAVLHGGRVLGLVPKSFIPNYKEFYEWRWFAAAATARSHSVLIGDEAVPFGTNLLFQATNVAGLVVGVELCEDLWVPVPPSSFQALRGATVLVNISSSNELSGKADYRRQLVVNQSARCLGAYVYASSGPSESTTDVVFGGHSMVAESGVLLGETERFSADEQLLVRDVDLDRLHADRIRTNSFGDAALYLGLERKFERVGFRLERARVSELHRPVDAYPFVPRGVGERRARCEEIFSIQVCGLAKRLEHVRSKAVAIGVSGGLDSTLALLVTCKTFDRLRLPRSGILAFSMPGFGTTSRTRSNAMALMEQLSVTAREVDIRVLCLEEMRALGHRPFGIDLAGLDVTALTDRLKELAADNRNDLAFENIQARMRTSILMASGFVVGTGDLSELALGWCTYNADHMSMYNPNGGIPKTLVKFLVDWAAENEFSGKVRKILQDVVGTEISPELLPTGPEGQPQQSTEGTIGPYELHDFFLHQLLRYGHTPQKVLFLARHATFSRPYAEDELRRWLEVFVRRFFANQYKRSCLPDGPKVGSVSLSPRGDWRMASDAVANLWLEWLS